MIIENGTIQFRIRTAGAIDPSTGYRSAASSDVYTPPMPCQFNPVTMNLQERVGGEAVATASFEIFVEADFSTPMLLTSEEGAVCETEDGLYAVDLTPFCLESSEEVRLRDDAGEIVAELPIIKTELLDAVCERRILI